MGPSEEETVSALVAVQLSEAVPPAVINAAIVVIGEGKFAVQETVTAAGHVITGAVLSTTVITLDTGASVLPHTSVAVQVSVNVPQPFVGSVVKVDTFEVPLIKHPPVKPLVNGIVPGEGIEPQFTVIGPGFANIGNAGGLTVITLDTGAIILPHASVAVHVSVTVPPHGPGVAVKVDGFDIPLIKHPPLKPLVNGIVLDAGTPPQATVMAAGAVIVGSVAGLTVITLDTGAIVLPHASVAVHVSVTVPPHAPGVAVNVDGFDVPLIKHPPDKPLL
jgi:hypothetical protein